MTRRVELYRMYKNLCDQCDLAMLRTWKSRGTTIEWLEAAVNRVQLRLANEADESDDESDDEAEIEALESEIDAIDAQIDAQIEAIEDELAEIDAQIDDDEPAYPTIDWDIHEDDDD